MNQLCAPFSHSLSPHYGELKDVRKIIVLTIQTILFLMMSFSFKAFAGVPEVKNIFITDVTTVSFSVIWSTNEACTAGLEVYADTEGASMPEGISIIFHPVLPGNSAIKTAAEDSGVMKVMVTGLQPDTTYYFKTISISKSTSDITLFPKNPPYLSVRTQYEITRTYLDNNGDVRPFNNDVIIESCYQSDGSTAAKGSLLIATISGVNYPISAFVGDGVTLPFAILDLNNAFSNETHDNIDLLNGENLTLLNFRGMNGNSIVTHRLPVDEGLSAVKNGEFSLKSGWNFVSIQLSPQDLIIENVLGDMHSVISAVWTYNPMEDIWYKYLKEDTYGITDLYELNPLKGYWVVVEEGQQGSLKVNGSFITEDSVMLYYEWNLIGLKSIHTLNLIEATGPVIDQIEAVWTYENETDDWKKYLKEDAYGMSDLYDFIPGKAYWVVVNNDVEWTFE